MFLRLMSENVVTIAIFLSFAVNYSFIYLIDNFWNLSRIIFYFFLKNECKLF